MFVSLNSHVKVCLSGVEGRKEGRKKVKAREAAGRRKVFVVFLSEGLSGVWRGEGWLGSGLRGGRE